MAVKRVIADVNDEVSKLNPILSGVVQSTGQMKQDLNDALTSVKAIKDAAKDIKMPKANANAIAGDSSEAKNSMNTFDPSPNASTIVAQTKDGARQTDYSQNGGNGGYTPGQGKDSYSGPDWQGYGGWKTGGGGTGALRAAGKAIGNALLGSAAAAGQAIDVTNYVTNEVSRRRFGFFSGNPGTGKGSAAFQSLMDTGTATSSLDAADAAMAGVSNGIMPGLSNYKTVMGSVAGISNMLPGAGLTASMGAVGALNQASSVNKLRMIGIQVRDRNGLMNGVEKIAKDLWDMLNRSKTGGAKITAQDLSYSLQSGMSLDSLLNQYFSGDPVLRDAIIAYLYQFASGHTATKGGLLATGANPSISQSVSKRNAAAYGAENAVTSAGITGIEWANTQVTNIANEIKNANEFVSIVRDNAVTAAAALEVITGAGNGAVGTLMGTALSAGKLALQSLVLGSTSIVGNIAAGPGRLAALAGHLGKIKNLGGIIGGTIALLSGGDDSSANANPNGNSATDPSGLVNEGVNPVGFVQQTGSQLSWASKILKGIGAPVTENNLRAMVSWMHAESSAANNYQGWNNPLNTTNTEPGSISKNNVGVQQFVNEASGIKATLETLDLPYYKAIVEDFKNNSPVSETLREITASKWGTGTINNVTINVDGSTSPTETAQTIADFLKNQR
jgi:hypothetical protein